MSDLLPNSFLLLNIYIFDFLSLSLSTTLKLFSLFCMLSNRDNYN